MALESAALRANMTAAIPIANVLSNSPLNNIPVNFELRRSLAEHAPKELNLVPANTPTNATFVQLPTFVRVAGTIGRRCTSFGSSPIRFIMYFIGMGLMSKKIAWFSSHSS